MRTPSSAAARPAGRVERPWASHSSLICGRRASCAGVSLGIMVFFLAIAGLRFVTWAFAWATGAGGVLAVAAVRVQQRAVVYDERFLNVDEVNKQRAGRLRTAGRLVVGGVIPGRPAGLCQPFIGAARPGESALGADPPGAARLPAGARLVPAGDLRRRRVPAGKLALQGPYGALKFVHVPGGRHAATSPK